MPRFLIYILEDTEPECFIWLPIIGFNLIFTIEWPGAAFCGCLSVNIVLYLSNRAEVGCYPVDVWGRAGRALDVYDCADCGARSGSGDLKPTAPTVSLF